MAQALSSRTTFAASLVKASPAGLPRLTSNVRLAARKVAVSSSLEKDDSQIVKQDQAVLTSTLAASMFSLMATAPGASAAQMVAELADDSRPLAVLGFLIPALGWVLFNIGKPALNQLDKMQSTKAFIGALGLAAAGLVAAESADAAQLIGQVADGDNRVFALLLPVVPALGWVLFNIARPAYNQLIKMTGGSLPLPSVNLKTPSIKRGVTKKGTTKRGVIGAIGVYSALALAENAEAAQEVATLAADNRPLLLAFAVAPALGWVLFNIARPALNQLNKMLSAQSPAPAKATKRK